MTVTIGEWTIERDYPHPPEKVFAAWADPDVKVRWFDLSDGDNTNYRSDFRVGGAESVSSPAGASPAFTYDAEYRDIVQDDRIVSTYEMTMDGRRISVSVATATFTATATGTRLRYTEQGAYLDDLDTPEMRHGGVSEQLRRLGDELDGKL